MLKMSHIHNVVSIYRTAKAAWQGHFMLMPVYACAKRAGVGCEGGFRL